MPKILFTDRERDVIRLVLELLAGGVVLTTALLAPGAAGVFVRTYRQLQQTPKERRRQAFSEMKRKGLIRVYPRRSETWLVLTRKGRKRLQKYQLHELAVHQPRVWDGYWRIVLFDIPRKPQMLNRSRDALRNLLKRLGFCRIQRSVWVHPFPCDDEVAYISEIYSIQPFVQIALAKTITGQIKLRQKFNL